VKLFYAMLVRAKFRFLLFSFLVAAVDVVDDVEVPEPDGILELAMPDYSRQDTRGRAPPKVT